jgi:hypothetical protein
MEIPLFLSHLPTYYGLPVPFTQATIDDVPDFRVVDPRKVFRCLNESLCAMCGNRLEEFCFFIGGPLGKENRLFMDPWMHEDCARFASKACPFVSGNKMEYSGRPVPDQTRVELAVASVRPSVMYLMKAKTAECKPGKMGDSFVIQAGEWVELSEIRS